MLIKLNYLQNTIYIKFIKWLIASNIYELFTSMVIIFKIVFQNYNKKSWLKYNQFFRMKTNIIFKNFFDIIG